MKDTGGTPSDSDPRPDWARLHLWQITAFRDGVLIGLVVFVLWLGYQLSAIFTPVLIALALAYLFDPLISRCEKRWNMPRPLTISIILVVSFVTFSGLGWWLVPRVVEQVAQLAQDAPRYLENIQEFLAERGIEVDSDGKGVETWAEKVAESPGTYLADKIRMLLAGTGKAFNALGNVLGATAYFVMTLVLIPLYFFFFAWHFGPLVSSFEVYLPANERERWLDVLGKMDRTISTYFRGRVIIALIMAVMFCVGWALAGVPHALLLGLAAGLLSLIPYASGLIWPVAVMLMYLNVTSGENAEGFSFMTVVFWPSFVFLVVQGLEGWVLTPWIQGKSMEMSVMAVLIVVLVGGALGGLYGLLLCIPAAACAKILIKEIYLPRLRCWAQEH